MLTRFYKWTDGTTDSNTESVWTNTFTVSEWCKALRFDLTGYGWKPSVNDEDLTEIFAGGYSIYTKKESEADSEYTLQQIIKCERDDTSTTTVYIARQAIISELDISEKTDVKIIAKDAEKYNAKATGVIEGITSGAQFWSGLKVKVMNYDPYIVTEANVRVEDEAGNYVITV